MLTRRGNINCSPKSCYTAFWKNLGILPVKPDCYKIWDGGRGSHKKQKIYIADVCFPPEKCDIPPASGVEIFFLDFSEIDQMINST